ncbi:MAG: ornithine carbamoyltransferase [Myxococcales bacterium]|nr:ornithine carbamoyltransferase [Myxococcales bacterium]MCB9580425.1 ornithine carbamoyltransferase [Polyangiaceae bacterium]
MTRHFLDLSDAGRDGLIALLNASDRYLEQRGRHDKPLAGKSVALVFEKASTRTRLSLEVAVAELGGHPVVITGAGSQIGRGEPIKDTARVLSRMVHGITLRTSGAERLEELARFSSVPVLNALTDASHPMQLLADLMTVRRVRGKLEGLRFAWLGDGNNMANSWIEAAGLLGLELTLACPEGFDPSPAYLNSAREAGAKIQVVRRPEAAVEGADVVSTDVFASMGQEAEAEARRKAFAGFTLTEKLVASAAKDVVVLHCLPAHRGEEIEEAVLEGERSFVWDEAEARLHTSKAALAWALEVDG